MSERYAVYPSVMVQVFGPSFSADITADVVGPIEVTVGLGGNGPLDRIAQVGSMTFDLNNNGRKYTPGDANAMFGWGYGNLVMLTLTLGADTAMQFYGYITGADPDPGSYQQRRVHVTASDFMDMFAKAPVVGATVMTNVTSYQLLSSFFSGGAMPIPQAANIALNDGDLGYVTFPTGFDNLVTSTMALSELTKIVNSEMGYVYLLGPGAGANQLRFESNVTRSGLDILTNVVTLNTIELAAENGSRLALETGDTFALEVCIEADFADTNLGVAGLEVAYGKGVLNRMAVTAYPKKVDTSSKVLFTLSYPLTLQPGQTITFRGNYSDPSGGANVSGKSMVAPVATTDYTMNTKSDGSGTDLTASLSVAVTYGSEGGTYILTNISGYVGYITKLQARGLGIYAYNPIEATDMDSGSIADYGYQSTSLDQAYQVDNALGVVEARKAVDRDKTARLDVKKLHFVANSSAELMALFMMLDIGDLTRITESQTDVNGYFYIQGRHFIIEQGPDSGAVVHADYLVRENWSMEAGTLTPIAVEYMTYNGTENLDFGYLPNVSKSATDKIISVAAWIYPTSTDALIIAANNSSSAGWLFYLDSTGNKLRLDWNGPNNAFAQWSASGISYNVWNHVVFVRDTSTKTNQPVIYINGESKTVTEIRAQAFDTPSEEGCNFVIGNERTANVNLYDPFTGIIKDVRVYKVFLSSYQISNIYNNGIPSASVQLDDLKLHAPFVRSANLAQYIDAAIVRGMNVIDNVYGAIGKPACNVHFDHSNNSSGSSVSSLTLSQTVATDNALLVVTVSMRNYTNVVGITFNGVALSNYYADGYAPYNTPRYEVWYLVNPPSGTHNVVVSLGANDWLEVCSASFGYVNQQTPLYGIQSVKGTQSTMWQNGISRPGDMMMDILAIERGTGNTLTVAQNVQTTLMNVSADTNWAGGSSIRPGDNIVNMGWSNTADGRNWIYAMFGIRGMDGPTGRSY